MARDYPRIGSTRDMRKKWTVTGKDGKPRSVGNRPRCAACGAEADYRVEVQVNWFRGDDEIVNACAAHKSSASELLKQGA